jgi:kynurenine formamidase
VTGSSDAAADVVVERVTVPAYRDLLARTDAPSGSSWGVFGDGDQVGTLNFLTPAAVRRGAAAVRDGCVFNLDHTLDAFPGPIRSRTPLRHVIQHFGDRPDGTFGPVEDGTSTVIDDYLDGFYPQASSQIDGLRHVAHEDHGLYGGVPRDAIRPGTEVLGIQHWADHGVCGRGVLVDVERYRRSAGRPLNHLSSEWIDAGDLQAALDRQSVVLQPGDMVLIRTGYQDHLRSFAEDDATAIRSAGLAPTRAIVGWLWDNQVSLVAADNLAVEAVGSTRIGDFGPGRKGRLHAQLVALLGLALGELWYLDALAAACAESGHYDFQLVCSPINLVGGVGTPANATAIA